MSTAGRPTPHERPIPWSRLVFPAALLWIGAASFSQPQVPPPAREGPPAGPGPVSPPPPEGEDEPPPLLRPPVDEQSEEEAAGLPEVQSKQAPSPGDLVVVVYKDGRRMEGTFTRSADGAVFLNVAGVTVTVFEADIERIEVLESPRQRYREMRALIPDTDVDRRLVLSNWLVRRGMYEEALREVEGVLAIEKNNGDALRMRRTIVQLILLKERKASGEDGAEDGPPGEGQPAPGQSPALAPEQINLIKVFEVSLSNPPRLIIPRETIERLLREHQGHPLIPSTRAGRDAFLRKSPVQVLDVMFRVRARDLYDEVRVVGNPASMEFFRSKVHSAWLINSAGSTRCHGGEIGGRLRLLNRAPNSETTFYTNFLILDRFRLDTGEPLIDYTAPERSPLLHLALPREDSLYPHPPALGWSPVFRSRDARGFRNTIEWIGMMYRPRPQYPITYEPPGPSEPPEEPEEPVER